MKKNKLKKIAGSIAVCGLCIATAVFSTLAVTTGNIITIKGKQSFAEGFVTVDLEKSGESYHPGITRIDEDFFSPYKSTKEKGNDKVGYKNPPAETLIPGSEREGSITFWNQSEVEEAFITVLFKAESTPEEREIKNSDGDVIGTEKPYVLYKEQNPAATYSPEKLKKASDLLVSKYLTLEVSDGDETVYEGSVDSMFVNIGKIGPGETKTFTFKLKMPGKELESFARPNSDEYDDDPEMCLDHGYDNTVAMIDWHFILSYQLAPVFVTETTNSPTITTPTTKYVPPPGTGEAPNMYLFAAIACGVSALVIFYVTFCGGKRRKREEE